MDPKHFLGQEFQGYLSTREALELALLKRKERIQKRLIQKGQSSIPEFVISDFNELLKTIACFQEAAEELIKKQGQLTQIYRQHWKRNGQENGQVKRLELQVRKLKSILRQDQLEILPYLKDSDYQ
jgi:hypothetical protein